MKHKPIRRNHKYQKPIIKGGLLVFFVLATFLLTTVPSFISDKLRPSTLPVDLGPLNDLLFLDTHPAYGACGDADPSSCACAPADNPNAPGYYCGGCPEQCGGITVHSCNVSYTLNPAPPENPDTPVAVVFPTLQSTNLLCVTLFQDNVNQPCTQDSTAPNGLRCTVNSSSPGTHTLQLKYGQGQLYPGVNCGTSVDCNSTTYTTSAPPAPGSPKIDSLQISNEGNSTFSSQYTKSGNQNNQGGANWYNPINITLTATQGTNPLSNYYVAFYDKASGPQLTNSTTFLKDITDKINSNPKIGFLLRYDKTNSLHYVWDPLVKGWINITGNITGKRICGSAGCDSQLYYTAYSGNASNNPTKRNLNLPNNWTIFFRKEFESKDMFTAGYIIDNQSPALSAFSADIQPK